MMKFLRRISGLPELTAKDVIEGLIGATLLVVMFYGIILLASGSAPVNAL